MSNNLLVRMEHWSRTKGITKQKPTVNGYGANIVMELGEYLDKPKHKTKHDEVDAVADIVVFSVTELFKIGRHLNPDIGLILSNSDYFTEWYLTKQDLKDDSPIEFNGVIMKSLAFYYLTNSAVREDAIRCIDSIVLDSLEKMVTMGYNPIIVMDEVLKVVESRTGKWCDKADKFLKDGSPEYEPHYARARRG